ncbi:hypothetical protein [Paractinoplanes deccanensis]|uniref:hypothetical protein n=1 Tax=Paractinoplanes deccanensis TaxID=113561 RepID=UPI001942281C|nr:hypothetical protein [Actinoplanes deccanensis]
MDRARTLWWLLAGAGAAGAIALLTAVSLFDQTPSPLLVAALPAYGVTLGLTRSRLTRRRPAAPRSPRRS